MCIKLVYDICVYVYCLAMVNNFGQTGKCVTYPILNS